MKEDYYSIFSERYDTKKYPYRKMWEDQARYIMTAGCQEMNSLSLISAEEDITNCLKDMVSFRPLGSENMNYDKAASFTYDKHKFMSKDKYYLIMKWFFSTLLPFYRRG